MHEYTYPVSSVMNVWDFVFGNFQDEEKKKMCATIVENFEICVIFIKIRLSIVKDDGELDVVERRCVQEMDRYNET